jgi:small subunit ribosomal protein S1
VAFLPGSPGRYPSGARRRPADGQGTAVPDPEDGPPRGNIVVSRRAVWKRNPRRGQRTELISQLAEGQVLDGVVKNITDYGAFVDLGGVDGLLHVTDIAWKRVNHPSQVLTIGQQVKVQVVRFNPETQRISLGMKQLRAIRGTASKPSTRSAPR